MCLLKATTQSMTLIAGHLVFPSALALQHVVVLLRQAGQNTQLVTGLLANQLVCSAHALASIPLHGKLHSLGLGSPHALATHVDLL